MRISVMTDMNPFESDATPEHPVDSPEPAGATEGADTAPADTQDEEAPEWTPKTRVSGLRPEVQASYIKGGSTNTPLEGPATPPAKVRG
jgi:hypothetical protein